MSRLRIASFNANSIRNRLPVILEWMDSNECDVLCVQETKVTDENFPLGDIVGAGYHCVFKGQKAYNGVAVITKDAPEDFCIGFGDQEKDVEARLLRVKYHGVTIVNTYVPQGTSISSPKFQYKLDWIRGMRAYFEETFAPKDKIVWVGDFNVVREPMDVYDPDAFYGGVCYHPLENEAFDYVMEWGFADVFRMHNTGEPKLYSFWDYRIPNALKRKLGWRIDHIWATHSLAERSVASWIDAEPRALPKPSDHTFIAADFAL